MTQMCLMQRWETKASAFQTPLYQFVLQIRRNSTSFLRTVFHRTELYRRFPFVQMMPLPKFFSKTALFSLYGGDPTTHHWCSDVPPLLLLLPQMPPRLKLPNLSATTEGKLHLLICEAIRSIRLKKMIPLKVYYYDGGFFKCLKLLSFVSSIVFRLSSPFSDERFWFGLLGWRTERSRCWALCLQEGKMPQWKSAPRDIQVSSEQRSIKQWKWSCFYGRESCSSQSV